MNLHFSKTEFDTRITQACQRMVGQDLEGLLLFKQESMYYLSGYDTDGFVLFQTLFLSVDGCFIPDSVQPSGLTCEISRPAISDRVQRSLAVTYRCKGEASQAWRSECPGCLKRRLPGKDETQTHDRAALNPWRED